MDETLETFEVHTSSDSVLPAPEFEGTNASRFALLATLGPDPRRGGSEVSAAGQPESSFLRFGFNRELAVHAGQTGESEDGYREAASLIRTFGSGWDPVEVRTRAWDALNEHGDLSARLALLAAGLCSQLERESATAATAILTSVSPIATLNVPSRWRRQLYQFVDQRLDTFRLGGPAGDLGEPPDDDAELGTPLAWAGDDWGRYAVYWLDFAIKDGNEQRLLAALRFLAQLRVDLGQRSNDPIVREMARAAYLHNADEAKGPPATALAGSFAPVTEQVSTMVHGTWGWKGDWWYPGGDLHRYIQRNHRGGLYGAGQEFSWSGAYSAKQRAIGGERFGRWAASAGGSDGLGTVFAHSYGGEIVARAVNGGAMVDEVVFLSAPVHGHHRQMLSRVRKVIDVRLTFDIVLTAARAGQRLPSAPNVVQHLVNRSLWSHTATHDAQLWKDEGIAARVGL